MYLHYISITTGVSCPHFGPYLKNCQSDLAESRLIGTAMRWLIRNFHLNNRVSIPIYVFMCFHYIQSTFSSYLIKCLCDLAESWLVGMAMGCLIKNIHKLRGISIPICVFQYFHYITMKATVFCPPFGPYLRNCLCDLAESRLIGIAMR